jgi:GrpB-like predicted nucleotidyltransferase (UPF0157 family)
MDREELNTYLDQVLIGGRERRNVVIVDPDPAWPERFARERLRIGEAIGEVACPVAHIGSTAVPGLAAKPIVDILVVLEDVEDVEDESAYLPQLERAGYTLRVREPGHRMFRTPQRDVHVHIWGQDDPEVGRHLAFRDRLRASAEDREAYERLKRKLAQQNWDDTNHYAQAKGPLVEEILTRSDLLTQ